MMITHNVFFNVKEFVSEKAVENAFKLIFNLQSQLSGVLRITGGKCYFHERKGEGYFSHGFSIDFVDENAYKDFFENPVTQPAKVSIINISIGGLEGMVGFDIGEFVHIQSSENRKYRIQAPRLRLTPPGSIF
jgi:hypothetical protein